MTLPNPCPASFRGPRLAAALWLAALATVAMPAVLATSRPAYALDAIVEKKTFTMPTYTTVSGGVLREVKVGWEAYGTLNADKSNVILITHFFSGTSHAAGKYKPEDKAPGYWDAIIGPGKPLDTDKYYIISSDTLVNLNAHDPNVVTTGPATPRPDTGKPYGMDFPVVGIRDFVNVQKALLESQGIHKLHAVMGASMGALQAYEWATGYPEMVGRVIPVIGAGDTDGWLVGWLDIWASPIRLDPNWNNGDYYGKTPPKAGLAQSLKVISLFSNYWTWADDTYNRKWAKPGEDPEKSFANRYAIEAALDSAGAARAETADANHLLYLVKANQTFAPGGDVGLARIKAPVLMISSSEDLVFPPPTIQRTADKIRSGGAKVEQVNIGGGRGHLNGVANVSEAADAITRFLAQ
ncbi:homoserine O-acetyltransferase [Azorhizobium oxalatiphilum]|uniref:Probable acyltransferase n=1 Tax=Azorhizobium oxalatiphilum TaxID=980631 RepID=A0A917FAU4_9HYPH|nr:homoserine O-acetyltransferase [Azorhizobium oxalatiphilum]GGF60480.1 homoserine O-acetyltransferase [Azorhizobium oxalatiphilum]